MENESKPGHLLFLVSRGHHKLADKVFNQIGLCRGQPGVLFELGKQDGLTQSELARKLEITQATLTNMLNRMETSELITRVQDPTDARFFRIYLTDHGRITLTKTIELKDVIDQIAFADFSPEEQTVLGQYLKRIHTNLTRK